MDKMLKFESRIGKVNVSSKKIFVFITDMRNFRQILPAKGITDWQADSDSCSFEVSPVGKANLRIINSDPDNTVKYAGDGLNNTQFFLWVQLKEVSENDTRVKITLKADLNPMIKVMASGPIKDFLEKLIIGMETFDRWDPVKE
ncbi:MAG: SRPBCC family protein [Bacteroidales bacterium]|nr:SRPBCC family protein [Bacteroidales bacterium]